jgi:hypothetical protein
MEWNGMSREVAYDDHTSFCANNAGSVVNIGYTTGIRLASSTNAMQ